MTDPNWSLLKKVTVPAKSGQGYWTVAFDYIDAVKRLKFIVEEVDPPATQPTQHQPPAKVVQKWCYAEGKECTADGDPKASINPANCFLPDAPPGALIAKVGGSTGGRKDGVLLFVVGSFCIVDLDDKTKGALFLTMNADPRSTLERSGELSVAIYHSA